jgi:hypothetical protein
MSRKFERKFPRFCVPSRNSIHNLVNKVRTVGMFIGRKLDISSEVLTEGKVHALHACSHIRRAAQNWSLVCTVTSQVLNTLHTE